MRMLVNVMFPIEPFNTMVKNGTVGELIGKVLEDIQPESIYFTEMEGSRAALMTVDLSEASDVPRIAEPWFLNFEAHCEFRIAMTADDLMKANLNELANKWK